MDICCGTGTIGLCMASQVRSVIGVELIREAVEDAKKNAEENRITNAKFIAGRAEAVFSELHHHLPSAREGATSNSFP